MKLKFTKMHGCGNDYIYIDCFRQTVSDPTGLSMRLSDRHFSIGGDGIVLICPSDVADVQMRMFNIDGSEGNMCGNAIRCIGKYAYERLDIQKETIRVDTKSGIKELKLSVQDNQVVSVTVDMGKAITAPKEIPVLLEGDSVVSRPVDIGRKTWPITCVSMGNPHCVVFVDSVEDLPLSDIGPVFEKNALFPEQVNTEFIRVIDEKHIQMRVWERGSGETLACGTGACAAVTACVLNGFVPADTPVEVHLTGGTLSIVYTKDTVFMTGPAAFAFDGEVTV